MSVLEAACEQASAEASRIFIPATAFIFVGLVALGLLNDVFNG